MEYKKVQLCDSCAAELELINGKCSYCGRRYVEEIKDDYCGDSTGIIYNKARDYQCGYVGSMWGEGMPLIVL